MLPRFIRQSGIGAAGRVARIHRARGTAGVFAEIGLIEGSFAKRVYFTELLKLPSIGARDVQQALAQAGREIDSDFELATLLIAADRLVQDEQTRKAYLDAARTIDSDFELRRVFSAALKDGPSPALLAGMLDTATTIESDFEAASLLADVAKSHPLDATIREPFFRTLATVDSSFEHRRVLTEVLRRADATPEALAIALQSVAQIESDFECATVLLQFVKAHGVEGVLRAPFFKAVETLSSSFERGRVLQAVARRSDAVGGHDPGRDSLRHADGQQLRDVAGPARRRRHAGAHARGARRLHRRVTEARRVRTGPGVVGAGERRTAHEVDGPGECSRLEVRDPVSVTEISVFLTGNSGNLAELATRLITESVGVLKCHSVARSNASPTRSTVASS